MEQGIAPRWFCLKQLSWCVGMYLDSQPLRNIVLQNQEYCLNPVVWGQPGQQSKNPKKKKLGKYLRYIVSGDNLIQSMQSAWKWNMR